MRFIVATYFLLTAVVSSTLCSTESPTVIGIEIDTSYLRGAVVLNGSVTVLKNEQGSELTPAYVAFATDGRMLIGDEAKCQAVANPSNTAFFILPLLGSNYDSLTVQRQMKLLPYRIERGDSNDLTIVLRHQGADESFSPVEILALLLRKLRELAEQSVGENVTSAVISVPSCLGYMRLAAIRDAGRIAGFTDEVLIVEATVATAVAYSYLTGARKQKLLVANAADSSTGAAVFDLSNRGEVSTMSQSCSAETGGDAAQQAMLNHLLAAVAKKGDKQQVEKLRQEASSMEKMRREAERAIRTLSARDEVYVQVESLINGDDFNELVTSSQFHNLIAGQLLKMRKQIKRALNDLDVKISEIDKLAIVGSLNSLPAAKIRSAIGDGRLISEVDADTSLWPVIGAAVQGSYFGSGGSGSPAVVTLCPGNFGYRTGYGSFKPMLRQGEPVVSTNERSETVTITDSQVAKFDVNIYEEVSEDGHRNYIHIGSVELDVPPESKTLDFWITFKMERFNKLQVTVWETKTSREQTVVFDHLLSPFRMQVRGRRGKWLLSKRTTLSADDSN